jgi:hypothetical protein
MWRRISHRYLARYKVLTGVNIKTAVFLGVMLSTLVQRYQHFAQICSSHLQGKGVSQFVQYIRMGQQEPGLWTNRWEPVAHIFIFLSYCKLFCPPLTLLSFFPSNNIALLHNHQLSLVPLEHWSQPSYPSITDTPPC